MSDYIQFELFFVISIVITAPTQYIVNLTKELNNLIQILYISLT